MPPCKACGFTPKRGRPNKVTVEQIQELRAKGVSLRKAAALLDISVSTVCRKLRELK